jgi:RHS repeat-associated protein
LNASEGPVKYVNGQIVLHAVDLTSSGFGSSWSHQRSYDNQLSSSADLGQGYHWLVFNWPYLVEDESGNVTVVRSTDRSLWFGQSGGQYTGKYGAKSSLVHDAENGVFVLTSPGGQRQEYYDFTHLELPGLFFRQVARGGEVTEVFAYTDSGRIQEIRRSGNVGASLLTEAFVYQYDASDRVTSVLLRRQLGAGAWQDVRQAVYEYYNGTESFGSLGDLKRVRIQVPTSSGWTDSDISYYRYYTGSDLSNGFIHGLKFVVEPTAYARMLEKGLDPLAISDDDLAKYADNLFQYDGMQRVVLERIEAGSRTFTFEYTEGSSAGNPNDWATRTKETRPDNSVMIVYSNSIGQALIQELQSGSDSWIEAFHYDTHNRLLWRANRSAVISYNDSQPDLAIQLRASSGLIETTEYYSTTGSGAAAGYVSARKLQNGSAATPVLQQTLEYAAYTLENVTIHPVSKQTVYRNEAGTDPIQTTYDYSFHSGTFQIQQTTTTLPVVSSAQNGTGVAATRKNYQDTLGRTTWSMDERGFINHYVYDLGTGAILQQIQDVNTSIVSGAPAGWTTPTGGGLNLVTDYQHDELGRITQTLGPLHSIDIGGTATSIRRANWNVYDDVLDAVYSGNGYFVPATSTYTLINPVSITVRNPKGRVVEQISATASSTLGTLASIIAAAGSGSAAFPQSSYTRWRTFQYTNCCKLKSERLYYNIPSSGIGTEGVNYNQTTYGYDKMNRRNRTLTPGGTITRLVHDVRGLILSQWVGTSDDGGTLTDPSGAGSSASNNMVVISENEYDSGQDGGDGNLTRRTLHVDATTVRVTRFAYDWRNRSIETDGEIDYFEKRTYDNLNRVIKTERYNTTASGNLLSRAETLFDDRSRVYRTIQYGVNPSTGAVSGSQTYDTTYDQANNVLRQEPAGVMAYQVFAYDSLGRRVSETDPLSHTRLLAYDAANNLTAVTDSVGKVWTSGFDPIGRLVRSSNPLAQSTIYGFNVAGEQATVTNPLGQTTTSTFDAAGRLKTVADPLNKITRYAYDADGNQISVTDPNNLTTASTFDYLDRLVKVTDPLNHTTEFSYNLIGELTSQSDAKHHSTSHVYDALGRKISTTDRLSHTTNFAWNALGLQASLTDAQNQTTSYVYDDYARLFQTIWPDHAAGSVPGDAGYGITQVEYDPLNRVFRTTDQLGDTVTHNYDLAGRLLSRDYRTRANSPSGTISDSDSFTYDANSNMLSAASGRYTNTVAFTYDDAGRKSSEALTISGQTYSCSTQYDSAGQVSKLIYPNTSEVTRTYTARGQLETIRLGTTTIDTRTYDDGGRMTASSYNNGVSESRSYNNDNTLATINYTGASIGNLAYTWDANKNKTAETISGVMSGYGFSAAYDFEDRLTSWNRADSTLNQSWNLSPVGNWNSITENASTQNRTHSPANEILTAASQDVFHDPKGNMTLIPSSLRPTASSLSLKWDFNNKLRAADTNNDSTDDVFYLWDALGRRVGRTAGGSTTIYFQNDQQTLADYVAGTSSSAPAFTYIWGSYIDELVLRTSSAGNYYFHRNQQYSIIAATTSAGAIAERYAYTAYGQLAFFNASGTPIAGSAIDNRYTYTGREWDNSLALYHYRARMYDSFAGRFCTRDLLGYFDGDNLYAAYWNLSGMDPTGNTLETQCEDQCGRLYPHWYQYHLFVGCISGCHNNREVQAAWECYSSCMIDIHTCPECLIGGGLAGQIEIVRSHIPVPKPPDLRWPGTGPWTTMNRIIAERLRGLGCEKMADAMHRAATRVNNAPGGTAPGRIANGIIITEAAFSITCSTTCTLQYLNSQ